MKPLPEPNCSEKAANTVKGHFLPRNCRMIVAEGGGGGEVQLEESLWGVRDPLSAGGREAEKDAEQLG